MSAAHELKTWPSFFAALWDGRKTFEVRYDDRGYQAGDVVILREYDAHAHGNGMPLLAEDWRYSGRRIRATVGYVLHGIPNAHRALGQPGFSFGDYVVMSLLDIERTEAEPIKPTRAAKR